jgi:hypothetical protein
MHSPEDILKRARDRAAEITWWNRRLTRLQEIPDVENVDEFLHEELVEAKGPYIEYVESPAIDSKPVRDRLSDFDYPDTIPTAVEQELFDGDAGSLYEHQAATIETIETTPDDVILTVPTATGKTEAFFLPILNACERTSEPGTKALIVYPMKTLAVDQLNRFISYLYHINRLRDPDEQITIGVWDGDTPQRIGSRERQIEAGSYVRGLEDPISGEKLIINSDGVVGSDDREYPWIKAIRNRVQQGADILLSTPEALDHVLVHDDADRRAVLGNTDNAHPIQHIVFDEAHVWSGVSGAGISLLVKRLKHFHREYDPKVSLISATVDNPEELACSLIGTKPEGVTAIGFSSRSLPQTGEPKFSRFEPCSTTDIVTALASCLIFDSQAEATKATSDLTTAFQTLDEIGILTHDELSIGAEYEQLRTSLRSAVKQTLDNTNCASPEELLNSPAARRTLTRIVLEDAGATSHWFEIVKEHVPEVSALGSWLQSDTDDPISFEHVNDIHSRISQYIDGNADAYLQTVFAFGRLAGLITDRYHAFLDPPRSIFHCRECDRVARRDICTHCGHENLIELEFCDKCHYPYWLPRAADGRETNDTTDAESRIPIGGSTPVDTCNLCGDSLSTSSIGVPTSSLLSYMLSEICLTMSSGKVLVFSDSHSAAESVARRIQMMEYGLTTESLYVKHLRDNMGTAPIDDVYEAVIQRLNEEYFEPYNYPHLDQQGPAYNIIQQQQQRISNQANLYETSHLISEALVTSEPLYQAANSSLELIVGHELYRRFADQDSVSFQTNGVEFYCLTLEKIKERIQGQIPECDAAIDPIIDRFVRLFYEEGIVHEKHFQSVRSRINDNLDEEDRQEVHADFVKAGNEFAALLDVETNEIDSGLLTRHHNRDTSSLRLIPKIARCTTCRSTYPVFEDDPPDKCFKCGAPLGTYARFTVDNEGEYHGNGVATIDSDSPWALDHWASDIMAPLQTDDEFLFPTVGIHKSNIPATLRGIIEEGFRKDPPEINIVSSTPTMELGVDIGTLESIAQVGMPPTLTHYVQRSGRTGRSQGSSSLVMTAIRGKHPVDNHYFEDLDRFFDSFTPVRIPPAEEFEPIVAAHVVTEVFGFLARNQHKSNTFERNYRVTGRNLDPPEFVSRLEGNFEALRNLITDEWREPLRDRIEAIFGEPGLHAFENVFEQEGSLNLLYRVHRTYGPLANSTDSQVAEELQSDANRLNLWLDHIGYLASYRSFGQDFPVEIEGYRDNISFESSGRLFEMFPGQENGRGAVFPLGGQQYLIDGATAGNALTTVKVCIKEDCDKPYESYVPSAEACPICHEPLDETVIHEIRSMHARKAGENEARWTTRGLHTTHVETANAPDERVFSRDIRGLDCSITVGEFELTDFVYAFERRHSSSTSPEIRLSEAEVGPRESVDEQFAPVGQQYKTSGLALAFDRGTIAERFPGEVHWSVVTASFEQALERAVAITGRFDLGDFQVSSTIDENAFKVVIADGQFGGNGVAWYLESELSTALNQALIDIVDCDNCTKYCEQCLLLPRTPPFYLENDLLNRKYLAELLDV